LIHSSGATFNLKSDTRIQEEFQNPLAATSSNNRVLAEQRFVRLQQRRLSTTDTLDSSLMFRQPGKRVGDLLSTRDVRVMIALMAGGSPLT